MNKHILSTSMALLLCLGACAQNPTTVKNKTAVKFSASIDKANAYKHLSVLASDEYEGRETGKKGAWMAADYIKNYFKSIGLKGPVQGDYFQPIDMVTYKLTQTVFTIDGNAKEHDKDFVIPAGNVSLQGFTFNAREIVFAGYGLDTDGYNDYAGIDVAGKVVLIFASGNPSMKEEAAPANRAAKRKAMTAKREKIQYLANHKALAVIQIDPSLDTLTEEMKVMFAGSGQLSLKSAENTARVARIKTFPTINVSTATANELLKNAGTTVEALQQKINSTGKPATQVVNITVSGSAQKDEVKVRAENVLGFLEGSDPVLKKEILVITGHYDHIGLTVSGTDKVNQCVPYVQ